MADKSKSREQRLRERLRRLAVRENALRLVVQDLRVVKDCHSDDQENPHGGDWESCWHCLADRALRRPQDFRMRRRGAR